MRELQTRAKPYTRRVRFASAALDVFHEGETDPTAPECRQHRQPAEIEKTVVLHLVKRETNDLVLDLSDYRPATTETPAYGFNCLSMGR